MKSYRLINSDPAGLDSEMVARERIELADSTFKRP